MTDAGPANRLAALTTRAEYVDAAMQVHRVVNMTAFAFVPVLLAILAMAGAAPVVTILATGGALTGAVAMRVFGPGVHHRAAVRLGIVDEHVVIGTEADTDSDVVRPLADVVSFADPIGPTESTTIDPTNGDYLVAGIGYATIGFRTPDGQVEQYRVAARTADPVAQKIIVALREQAPEPAEQKKKQKQKEAAPRPDPVTAEPLSTAADDRLWAAAQSIHDTVLGGYARYELEPELFLRYPGVTDVTRESVQDFQHALAEAQALRTNDYPGDATFAGRYRSAVDALRRAWARCEADGKTAGTEYLPEPERSDIVTARKLLAHAESTDGAEQIAYLRRVREIIVRLEERGIVHPPRPVVAAIESATRRALEG